MTPALDFHDIESLIGDRFGRFDFACPLCGPERSRRATQQKKTLSVWREEESFARYFCARCEAKGWARADGAARSSPVEIANRKAESDRRAQAYRQKQVESAASMWRRAYPAKGSPIVENYLRARGITDDPPGTMKWLPARLGYADAMLMPFGIPHEPMPGDLVLDRNEISALHLTRLKPDGSDRIREERGKIIVGSPAGRPLVIAPVNDSGALGICEGIEDALAVHQVTGIGAWAAGSCTFMPALAAAVPRCVEEITVFAHDDGGRPYALGLADALVARGFTVFTEGLR